MSDASSDKRPRRQAKRRRSQRSPKRRCSIRITPQKTKFRSGRSSVRKCEMPVARSTLPHERVTPQKLLRESWPSRKAVTIATRFSVRNDSATLYEQRSFKHRTAYLTPVLCTRPPSVKASRSNLTETPGTAGSRLREKLKNSRRFVGSAANAGGMFLSLEVSPCIC